MRLLLLCKVFWAKKEDRFELKICWWVWNYCLIVWDWHATERFTPRKRHYRLVISFNTTTSICAGDMHWAEVNYEICPCSENYGAECWPEISNTTIIRSMVGTAYYPDSDILKTCLSGWNNDNVLKSIFWTSGFVLWNVGKINSNSWWFRNRTIEMYLELGC